MLRTLLLIALLGAAPCVAFADAPPPPADAGSGSSSDGGCAVTPGSSGALPLGAVLTFGVVWAARRRRQT